MRAVVLLSGGLDSYTAAAIAKADGFALCALTIHYGNGMRERSMRRGASPTRSGRRTSRARSRSANHRGSALTAGADVPHGPRSGAARHSGDVRAGAQYHFSVARARLGRGPRARDLVIGVNALDYSGYPDCRPEFIRAFEQVAASARAPGVEGGAFRIHTPLIDLTKAQIIRRGLQLRLGLSADAQLLRPAARRVSVQDLRQLCTAGPRFL
jgi:7-cyano-7-deazaguanine synthase